MPAANKPKNEAERLAALRSYEILDTPPDPRFDDITALAKDLFGVPIAVVSLVDANRQWFKSCIGLDVSETSRDVAFCAYTILESRPLVIQDARSDVRFSDNPLVTEEPGIQFYAGVPIVNDEGLALGSLCVIDFVPREPTETQIEMLLKLGRLTLNQMESYKHGILLQQHTEEVEKARNAEEVTRQKLEHVLRSRNAILAGMSQEIRTPITTIMGLSDILVQDTDKDTFSTERAAGAILSNARYLLEVINTIVEISGDVNASRDFEPSRTSLFEVAQDVEKVVQLNAENRNLSVLVDFHYPFPSVVYSDTARLKRSLVGLLNYVVNHSTEGPVRLSFQGTEESVTIEIMSPDFSSSFLSSQSSGSAKIADQPFLYAKRTVEWLQGKLSVEGAQENAKIVITLPVGGDATLVRANPLNVASQDPTKRKYIGQILVVEDDRMNQRLITHILKKSGIGVVCASDGQEGLDVAREQDFDLVFLDYNLPVMNGVEVARKLSTEKPSLPIVALTGVQSQREILDLIEAGCKECISKPFERNQLHECLKRYLPTDVDAMVAESRGTGTEELVGNEEFASLVLGYLGKLQERLIDIREAFDEKDWQTLREESHKLVSAGLFGFPKVSLLAKLLEEQANLQSAEGAEEVLTKLRYEIEGLSDGKSESVKSSKS